MRILMVVRSKDTEAHKARFAAEPDHALRYRKMMEVSSFLGVSKCCIRFMTLTS